MKLLQEYQEITSILKKMEDEVSILKQKGINSPMFRDYEVLKGAKSRLFGILYGKFSKGTLSQGEITLLKQAGLYYIFEKVELKSLLRKYSSKNSKPITLGDELKEKGINLLKKS